MANRVCTTAQNVASAEEAKKTGNKYGPAWVTVLDVSADKKTVKLRAPGVDGYPIEFTCSWDKDCVWATCPTTLNCDVDNPPAAFEEGVLYLSKKVVSDYELAVNVKWPDDLPASASPRYCTLEVWPVSLTIHAVELVTGEMRQATIDLLDPNAAETGQTITLGYQPVKLALSNASFKKFPVAFPSDRAIEETLHTLRAGRNADARAKAFAWTQVATWQVLVKDSIIDDPRAKKLREALGEVSTI